MPDQISVSEFLSETTEDYNSPTTSSFTTRLQSCRNTVNVLEERASCSSVFRQKGKMLLKHLGDDNQPLGLLKLGYTHQTQVVAEHKQQTSSLQS
uniref:Uncharacterized protein n=1 Tax=Seriola lalandi dorsalis TaxID=1841481 RepID=A0A3B4YRK8_SERLL